jgi:predicted MarR family transcription regulator
MLSQREETMANIDKTWHLAATDDEIKVTDFELSLWRIYYGFQRWQEECEKAANDSDLTGDELAILHVIRMKNRPKTIAEIGRLLNRDDTFNIKYSINKLTKKKLIKPVTGSKRTWNYQVTEEGLKNTEAYTDVRRNILIDLFSKHSNLKLHEWVDKLAEIKSIYDEAVRVAAAYSPALEDHPREIKQTKKGKKS